MQNEEHRRAEIEDLSRAFGLLLHSTGAKTRYLQTEAIKKICTTVKCIVCTRKCVRQFEKCEWLGTTILPMTNKLH